MAQSPRPPGPVRALGPPRGLRSLGTKGPKRVADQIAGGRRKAPGLGAVSVSPQTSLGRDGPSKGANQAGPGLHDTARSGPGPDPGPTQALPRGRAGAQLGPVGSAAPHSPPSSSSLSLVPCLHFQDAPTARPGWAYPARWVPRCAHPQGADGRALTLTQLRRPWRALHPAGGCGGPQVTALRGGRRQPGPGLGSPGAGGGKWRRQTRRPPSRFLPAALGRWTSGRATLAPDPRGGSGSDDSNDGSRRFAKTERRRAESSEGEVLSPQPISVCPGDSRPPLRASPQQPADRSQSGNSFVAWLPPQGRNTPSNATSIGRNATLPRRIGISDQSTKRIGPDRLAKGEPLFLGGKLSHLAPVHWLLSLPY